MKFYLEQGKDFKTFYDKDELCRIFDECTFRSSNNGNWLIAREDVEKRLRDNDKKISLSIKELSAELQEALKKL